ncbi:MAG TPA: hypothetical protein VHI13_10640 [Candidatus Kapabacteria bacterium]|nr:hypothetical protein [Candidatus Kapabacteria bacterium]
MNAARRAGTVCGGALCVLMLAAIAPALSAQMPSADSLARAALENAPSTSSLLELFLPNGVRAGYLTRAWLRDSLPRPSDSLDDLVRTDLIYLRALGESGGDIGTALLASLIACFEHRTIPLSIGIRLPLTLEPEDAFQRRVSQLPKHLFADNPNGDDRDKLQHFFASAWLAWTLDNREMADVVGLGVEAGEEAFVDGGANDPRDVRANRLGQLYVQLLRSHPRALPSTMFRAWNRKYGTERPGPSHH